MRLFILGILTTISCGISAFNFSKDKVYIDQKTMIIFDNEIHYLKSEFVNKLEDESPWKSPLNRLLDQIDKPINDGKNLTKDFFLGLLRENLIDNRSDLTEELFIKILGELIGEITPEERDGSNIHQLLGYYSEFLVNSGSIKPLVKKIVEIRSENGHTASSALMLLMEILFCMINEDLIEKKLASNDDIIEIATFLLEKNNNNKWQFYDGLFEILKFGEIEPVLFVIDVLSENEKYALEFKLMIECAKVLPNYWKNGISTKKIEVGKKKVLEIMKYFSAIQGEPLPKELLNTIIQSYSAHDYFEEAEKEKLKFLMGYESEQEIDKVQIMPLRSAIIRTMDRLVSKYYSELTTPQVKKLLKLNFNTEISAEFARILDFAVKKKKLTIDAILMGVLNRYLKEIKDSGEKEDYRNFFASVFDAWTDINNEFLYKFVQFSSKKGQDYFYLPLNLLYQGITINDQNSIERIKSTSKLIYDNIISIDIISNHEKMHGHSDGVAEKTFENVLDQFANNPDKKKLIKLFGESNEYGPIAFLKYIVKKGNVPPNLWEHIFIAVAETYRLEQIGIDDSLLKDLAEILAKLLDSGNSNSNVFEKLRSKIKSEIKKFQNDETKILYIKQLKNLHLSSLDKNYRNNTIKKEKEVIIKERVEEQSKKQKKDEEFRKKEQELQLEKKEKDKKREDELRKKEKIKQELIEQEIEKRRLEKEKLEFQKLRETLIKKEIEEEEIKRKKLEEDERIQKEKDAQKKQDLKKKKKKQEREEIKKKAQKKLEELMEKKVIEITPEKEQEEKVFSLIRELLANNNNGKNFEEKYSNIDIENEILQQIEFENALNSPQNFAMYFWEAMDASGKNLFEEIIKRGDTTGLQKAYDILLGDNEPNSFRNYLKNNRKKLSYREWFAREFFTVLNTSEKYAKENISSTLGS